MPEREQMCLSGLKGGEVMLKKLKLSQKLALVIGVILAVSLTVLVGLSAYMSGNAISAATYGELESS